MQRHEAVKSSRRGWPSAHEAVPPARIGSSPPPPPIRTPRAHPADTAARVRTETDSAQPAATEAPIRAGILLVDGQALLARALAVALNLHPGLRVVVVDSEPAGVRRLAADLDVILLDSLPLAAQLRAARHDARLVMLGGAGDDGTILACIHTGVAACVDGTASPDVLVETIRRVCAGELVYETAVLVRLLREPTRPVAALPRLTHRLGRRELEVLTTIATGAGSDAAAQQLGISLHTLRTHLKNAIAKLEARSTLEAVLIAVREGAIPLDRLPAGRL